MFGYVPVIWRYKRRKEHKKVIKNKFVFTVLILVYVLSGCASEGLRIENNYDMSKNPGKSIVIGKISAKLKTSFSWPTSNAFVLVNQSSEKKIITQHFSRDKHFFVALDAGEYNIKELILGYGISGSIGLTAHDVPLSKAFSVSPDEVVYIGKLSVEYTADESYGVADVQITISDEYDLAVEEFRKLYPNIKKDVRKNLLQ
jgi:hypothetical protein